jgi:HEPN domain-containing protein
MAEADPRLQAEEAARWLTRADRDVAAVERAIGMEPLLTDVAAYHCQQAAEKLLKAALVLAAVRPPKTHDLVALAAAATAAFPTLAASAATLSVRTTWAYAFRYPLAQDQQEPEPTADEIRVTLSEIARLRASLLHLIGPAG